MAVKNLSAKEKREIKQLANVIHMIVRKSKVNFISYEATHEHQAEFKIRCGDRAEHTIKFKDK